MRQRWYGLGVRRRVHLVFFVAGLLLAVFVGLTIWVLARGYLLNLRQAAAVRTLRSAQGPGAPAEAWAALA